MLRILLAEDVAMVRGALIALIELEPDLKVVAAVESGADIVPTALTCRPDVAVIDVDLPGLDGLSAAAQLKNELPRCRALILTNLGRSGMVSRALSARVSGFMLKDSPPEELATAIRSVAIGRKVEIASALYLSVGTVRNYLTTIVTKLHARNRVDAVKRAYDSGWLP